MMFNNVERVTIGGGSFTNVQREGQYVYNIHYHSYLVGAEPRQLALDRLLKYIAPGAFHNSEERYDAPKCHPHTRESILKEIMDWIEDPNNRRLFLWLYGPAGAGKSAIAQTIAELCEQAGIHAASFFFSRTAFRRHDKSRLIPTLAYQLISSIPGVSDHVFNALSNDPALFSRSIVTQIDLLISRPLNAALARQGNAAVARQPILIIIDGLDECAGHKAQSSILEALFRSIHRFKIPLYFLIASRPELEIRNIFNLESVSCQVKGLALDDVYQSDHDIEIFLHDKFEEIKRIHPSRASLPAHWPTQRDLSRLVEKASGQFIYASVIMKVVESPRHRPMDRLKVILGISPPGNHTPFMELDALYSAILSSVEADSIQKVIELLGYLILHSRISLYLQHYSAFTSAYIEDILGYEQGDIHIILSDLHSLIHVPDDGGKLKIHHASLPDYLLDHSRSGNFFIDSRKAHAKIATSMLRSLRAKPTDLTLVGYILFHCRQSEPSQELMAALYTFDLAAALPAFACYMPTYQTSLYVELDLFFQWLDDQKHTFSGKDLLCHHLDSFNRWFMDEVVAYPQKSPSNLCALIALLPFCRVTNVYAMKTYLRLETLPSGPLDTLIESLSKLLPKSYLAPEISQLITDPSRAGPYVVDGEDFTKLAKTLATFIFITKMSYVGTNLGDAVPLLAFTLPKASIDVNLAFLLSNQSVIFHHKGQQKLRDNVKDCVVKLAMEALRYIKRCDIPYTHSPVPGCHSCVVCDFKFMKVNEDRDAAKTASVEQKVDHH